MEWYYYVGGVVVGLIVALIFETSREFIVNIFEDLFDFLGDILGDVFGDFGEGIIYVISFEWVGDIPEFFGSMFEGLSEFSWWGITFGLFTTSITYFLSDYLLTPFLQYYTPSGKILWGVITYLGTFGAGYFLGKHFENT